MSVALLHIGTHRTGSTSFQQWALAAARQIREQSGVAVYEGRLGHSHSEFPLLCMRANREMHRKVSFPDWCLDEWQSETRAHIEQQVAHTDADLLITAENLSLLRYPDELEALRRLLEPRTVRVAACLREPADFLESYRALRASQGIGPSPYRASFAYTEPDTWLIDYDGLLGAYRDAFGDDAVVSFRYEDAMATWGSTIPGVLAALEIDGTDLPSWREFHRNETVRRSFVRRVRSKVGRVVRRVR